MRRCLMPTISAQGICGYAARVSLVTLGRSFANDLDALDQREGENPIRLQVLGGLACCKRDGVAGGIQHVPQAHQVTGRHIGRRPSLVLHLENTGLVLELSASQLSVRRTGMKARAPSLPCAGSLSGYQARIRRGCRYRLSL